MGWGRGGGRETENLNEVDKGRGVQNLCRLVHLQSLSQLTHVELRHTIGTLHHTHTHTHTDHLTLT